MVLVHRETLTRGSFEEAIGTALLETERLPGSPELRQTIEDRAVANAQSKDVCVADMRREPMGT